MQEYVYAFSPSHIIMGKDAELQTGKWVKRYGGTRVMVHHDDGFAKQSGLIERVMRSITDEGLMAFEFGGAVPNPRIDRIREGGVFGREHGIDFIVAVGGGSVIDSAKGIGIAIPDDGDPWDFYDMLPDGRHPRYPERAIPKGVVLTMPASGSEGSYTSVVTKMDEHLKRTSDTDIHRPLFAIQNPELAFSLTPFQCACCVMDALSHAIERYFTPDSNNELTDRLCEAVMLTCLSLGRTLIDHPGDHDALTNLMTTSTLAQNGFLSMGRMDDWSSHMLEHELSGEYDIVHAVGLAALVPAWMKLVWPHQPRLFVQFATRVMGCSLNHEHPEETIREGIARLEAFIRSLGLKTHLSEVPEIPPLTEEIMWKLAKRVRISNSYGTIGRFKVLSHAEMVEIYKLAL